MTLLINLLRYYWWPVLLWGLVWANINSGFWNFEDWHQGGIYVLHTIRSVFPYFLPFFGIYYWRKIHNVFNSRLNPVFWLLFYGWIALGASCLSPDFEAAFYFGAAFLMGLLVPAVFFRNGIIADSSEELLPEKALLLSTWLILAFYVSVLAIFFDSAFVAGGGIFGVTGEEVGGMAMTRSSGVGRFFGVAGLLCLVRLWCGHGKMRLAFAGGFTYCCWVIWMMQSRGAMFGFAFSCLVVLILARAPWRLWLGLGALGIVLLWYGDQIPEWTRLIAEQVARGQSMEELESMTGRTRAYQNGWQEFLDNPLWGQGNWADRLTIGEHVHNSYLQALMNAGILGFIPYLWSWIVGWQLFIILHRRYKELSEDQRILCLECAAVMAFFSIRSIPETTTASFSVDQLLTVPTYFYLFITYRRLTTSSHRIKQ